MKEERKQTNMDELIECPKCCNYMEESETGKDFIEYMCVICDHVMLLNTKTGEIVSIE
jgi:hypothetical protein